MDRSLWLLLRLKLDARLRRATRSIRTLKGLLLAVVGSLVFLPSIAGILFMPRFQSAVQLTSVRRYGPLILFVYCIMNVLLSSGDRAVHYSPAEVNFLFAGPYRPRQLLIYKIVGGIGGAFFTTLFMTFAFRHHAAMSLAAFLGLFLGRRGLCGVFAEKIPRPLSNREQAGFVTLHFDDTRALFKVDTKTLGDFSGCVELKNKATGLRTLVLGFSVVVIALGLIRIGMTIAVAARGRGSKCPEPHRG